MKTLLSSAAILAVTGSAAMADFNLTILHTNDFHARFEPISRFNSGCREGDNEEGKCFGGSARLVTGVEAAKERAENWLLVDGGDQFQGTLFYTFYKGSAAAEMMNKMGYDGMTVGNHEFDDGPEILRDFIGAVDFPILMSNADVSREPLLSDVIQKSTIVEKGGEKIGLIGLTPQNTDEIASPGPNVIFTDPSQAVQGEVDKLTDMGVNKIVVLSHSGYSVDQRVAANTTGVDVIVGGHSNTLLSNTEERADGPYPTVVNGVQIVQAFAYGKFLGELNVTFDDAGNVSSAEGDLIIMDASVEENADTKARISELAEALDEVRNQVVAEAAEPIDGDRSNCRYRECQMGNLVAEAILDRVRDQGIQIAIQNGGGLRASIDGGEITMGEVYTVLPFQNALSTFFVSGATIKDALENAVAQYDDPEKDGRFAQVAGMRYQIDPSQSTGERIVEILIDEAGDGTFTPIDLTKSYGVVANDFVRRGGDGYSMFNEAENAYDFGPDLAEVVADFLEREGPYAPFLDGRIAILE